MLLPLLPHTACEPRSPTLGPAFGGSLITELFVSTLKLVFQRPEGVAPWSPRQPEAPEPFDLYHTHTFLMTLGQSLPIPEPQFPHLSGRVTIPWNSGIPQSIRTQWSVATATQQTGTSTSLGSCHSSNVPAPSLPKTILIRPSQSFQRAASPAAPQPTLLQLC